MTTGNFLKEYLGKVFSPSQAEVLAEVISSSYANLVQQNDFNELKGVVKELAEAQKRTEQKVEKLAEAMEKGFQKVNEQISALGSRWGIKNETMIRNTLGNLLKKTGFQVSRGFYGNREVDILIRNEEHILLEITSSAQKKDIRNLNLSAEDYYSKHKIEPRLILAAVYISPAVMKEILTSPRNIDVYSGDEEDEEIFLNNSN